VGTGSLRARTIAILLGLQLVEDLLALHKRTLLREKSLTLLLTLGVLSQQLDGVAVS
jgi:hypothetical protein